MPLTALFGGTFDPVHNGHLAIAREALLRFPLGCVLFVPAANPPHKLRGAAAPYEDRVRMTELACAGEPRFRVSRIEENTERSYSIDTIERLHAAAVGPLAFLIGADAFAEIETWHRWRDVVASVEFIVVTRPGAEYRIPAGAQVHSLDGLELEISSSDIRARIAKNDYDVPVPEPVIGYIRKKRLYQSQPLEKSRNPCSA
jgi:nicotinate-nucleotide adenylyltransferase